MRKKIDLIILALVLIAGIFALQNAVAIGDWWHARAYEPPSEVVRLADDAGMSETGRQLFYRFSPQILDEAAIRRYCGGIKLGCIEGRHIYILHYETEQEYNRAVVTAAHEMLHVAYSRLDDEQLEKLLRDIDEQLDDYPDDSLLTKLEGYSQEEFYPEAHSFIGTESPTITAALTAHYKKYFDDRNAPVRAYRLSPEGRR
jgi:ribosomal protein L12E/L44/L45/RPP1/RPP2